jgi:hypothetical protein
VCLVVYCDSCFGAAQLRSHQQTLEKKKNKPKKKKKKKNFLVENHTVAMSRSDKFRDGWGDPD